MLKLPANDLLQILFVGGKTVRLMYEDEHFEINQCEKFPFWDAMTGHPYSHNFV